MEGWGGMDWFVYFKNLNIDAPVKTADLVQPLPKALWIFISTIPNGFQIANQKTRRRSKTLNGSHRIAGEPNLLKISVSLPLIKIYELKWDLFQPDPSRWTSIFKAVFCSFGAKSVPNVLLWPFMKLFFNNSKWKKQIFLLISKTLAKFLPKILKV